MALCRYLDESGKGQYALYQPGQICPLSSLMDDPPIEQTLFDRVEEILSLPQPEESQWKAAPETLLPPVPPPEKVFCIGLNYRDHAIETGSEIPTEPVVFIKLKTAIVGDGDGFQLPRGWAEVEYVGEGGGVGGRGGAHV